MRRVRFMLIRLALIAILAGSLRPLRSAITADNRAFFISRKPPKKSDWRKWQSSLVRRVQSVSVEKLMRKMQLTNFPFKSPKNVYYCGFNSEKSFGAWSYLIVRPEGNILVDSPRFSTPLVKNIGALGGVSQIFLTPPRRHRRSREICREV